MAATMTTSTFATLRIRFIEDDDHPSNDEWIRIVPIHNQNATAFGQEYKITSNLGGVEHTSSVQCSNILVQYVSNILRLVAVDDAPCKQSSLIFLTFLVCLLLVIILKTGFLK